MNYDYSKLRVEGGTKVNLKNFATCEDGGFTKKTAKRSRTTSRTERIAGDVLCRRPLLAADHPAGT